ncbi:hypothetical protein GFS31_39150 [Leptolyngbya sp. BL0902]|nr:hypothetical protein GFS31_39150 [Leptolyngbya sp. BL0902]
MVSPVASSKHSIERVQAAAWRQSWSSLGRWRPSPQQAYLWGLGLGSFALGLVNGALVISTGIGVLAYRQLAQLSPAQQQALRQRIQSAVPLPRSLGRQALVLSLMLGASTYSVTALWQSTHSLLMALVLTGQTALTFFVVVALLRSPTDPTANPHPTKRADDGRRSSATGSVDPLTVPQTLDVTPAQSAAAAPAPTEADRLEQALAHLTQADSLQRLIAVRQLVRLAHQADAETAYIAGAEVSLQDHLIDCFHLMLAHDPEPVVRSAVREGLALLRQGAQPGHQLPAGGEALPDLSAVAPDPWFEVAPAPPPPERLAPAQPQASSPPRANPAPRRTVEYIEVEI